jgi:hypothetical protein
MQPLRRRRLLCRSHCSKAFACARKRPGTKLASLVHRVAATLDPTNLGLQVQHYLGCCDAQAAAE